MDANRRASGTRYDRATGGHRTGTPAADAVAPAYQDGHRPGAER